MFPKDMSLSLTYGVSGLHRLHETRQLVVGGSDVGGRASVPTVQSLNVSPGTFCDKAGGRELVCGLAMTSIWSQVPVSSVVLGPPGSFLPKDAIGLPREVIHGKRKRECISEQP